MKRMVDPREGLVAQGEFLPSVAEVKKWLDNTPYQRHSALPPPRRYPKGESPEEKRAASKKFWSERVVMSERALRTEQDPDKRKYWEEKFERAHYHLDNYDEIIKEKRG